MLSFRVPGNPNRTGPVNLNGLGQGYGMARKLAPHLLALLLCSGAALAQTVSDPTSASEDMIALLMPKPHAASNPLLKPSREYRGMAMGDWMFYPTALVGVVYDDNLVWSTTNKVSAVGTRFKPRLVAVRDEGIHKTTAYGEVDARLYPSLTHNNTINGQAGLEHVWEVERDFTIKAKAEYEHKALHISGGLVSTPSGVSTLATPLQSDQLMASLTAQKSFGKAFVGGSLETRKTLYGPLDTAAGKFSQQYRDSFVNTATLRGGYWFAPSAYVFAEGGGNMRDYTGSAYASKGYRAVAGLGTDRLSLFRGEIFGGIQQQFYEHHVVKTATSPVFGGKIFWYPTRALTVRLAVDQTFSDSSTPTPSNPGGYPQRVTAAQLSINYQFARDLYLAARVGYDRAAYLGVDRRDTAWRAGASLSYDMYRSLGIVLDYDYTQLVSTAPNASYTRNAVTVSLKYQY